MNILILGDIVGPSGREVDDVEGARRLHAVARDHLRARVPSESFSQLLSDDGCESHKDTFRNLITFSVYSG